MLSQQSRPYIDASVPVLREHGLAITKTFYSNMFAERPDLTNLFNMGNQASGVQQQSLASAVFAYAANYDRADVLAPVLDRIVHKHAAVGLKPSHYTIVGRHLLGAIKQVLGDAATPELMAAWDEAYWLLAGELIAAEGRLYERSNAGPDHRLPLRITERDAQGSEIVALTLAATDGTALPDFQPGQYVSVVVELSPGVFQQRQYSLSDAPNGSHWRISVKREAAGQDTPAGVVSNWLHDNANVGDVLMVSRPYGDFAPVLDGKSPIALLSAGVGITPMIAVLNTMAQRNPARPVLFAHAARDHACLAHLDDVAEAGARMPAFSAHYFLEAGAEAPSAQGGALLAGATAHSGRMRLAALFDARQLAEANTDFYLCGPLPFMQAQRAALLEAGVPSTRIHREVFGPDLLDDLL
ncbi:globin domain-containing protein [Bordetella sp. N]|uniref:globin domain-containing protein n=1 Tax=Bordetella sp. N TaxID=1746199 RepID=UPI00070D7603|nr:globin domain-containing protein [Bordetella sp. N]ALM81680.1 flavohemoprotein [Bordetella sp. N]